MAHLRNIKFNALLFRIMFFSIKTPNFAASIHKLFGYNYSLNAFLLNITPRLLLLHDLWFCILKFLKLNEHEEVFYSLIHPAGKCK